jgi:hypothetical protein
MNISPIANDLIEAINNYLNESSRVQYRFTLEEEISLTCALTNLKNRLETLSDYEIKRENEEK